MKINNKGTYHVPVTNMQRAAQHFKAVNHPLRQQLLLMLQRNQEMPVSSIYQQLKLEQSITSLHLSILHKASLVTVRLVDSKLYYSINYTWLKQLHMKAEEVMKPKAQDIL
jgi:DNA-binding transcriptional ArsR family regulator